VDNETGTVVESPSVAVVGVLGQGDLLPVEEDFGITCPRLV
jgi:hypothetical protein